MPSPPRPAAATRTRPVIPGERRFRDGDHVRHPAFGDGTVVTSKLTRDDEEVTVAFPERGVKKLLASLTPEQRAKATFELKSDARFDWHFIPKERKGLPLKEMTEAQRPLALALLASGLSRQGFSTATNIMSLEPVLAEQEGAERKFPRDPLLYPRTSRCMSCAWI